MFIINSTRVYVKHLEFYNCNIIEAAMDESGADADGTDRSDLQLNLAFEHYSREFLNV
jgi:hypothetical protein